MSDLPESAREGQRRHLDGLAIQHNAPRPNRYTPSAESPDAIEHVDESVTLTEGIVPGADVIPSRTQAVLDAMSDSPVSPAVEPERTESQVVEAIIHDWTCGCGKGQACPNRDGCREAAAQIISALAGSPSGKETPE